MYYCSSYQVSENDLYSSISGVVVFVSRWMLFVSFLRHSPINSHFPEGNNFGGLVLFSLPPKRFFARFLLRGTQRTRRYITRYVWVSRDVGGACTGRLKSLGLALFSGAASPNQKSRHHDMKTGK